MTRTLILLCTMLSVLFLAGTVRAEEAGPPAAVPAASPVAESSEDAMGMDTAPAPALRAVRLPAPAPTVAPAGPVEQALASLDKVLSVLLKLLGAGALWVVVSYVSKSAILKRAMGVVGSVVWEVWSTYTSALKAAKADGKLTRAEAEEARARAWSAFKSNLGEKGLKRLGDVLGVDVEGWFRTASEHAYGALKAQAAPSPKAVLVPFPAAIPASPSSGSAPR